MSFGKNPFAEKKFVSPFGENQSTKKRPLSLFGKTPYQPIQHTPRKKEEKPIVPRDWNPFRPIKHLKQPLISPFSEIMADYNPEKQWYKYDPETYFLPFDAEKNDQQGMNNERLFERDVEFDLLYNKFDELLDRMEQRLSAPRRVSDSETSSPESGITKNNKRERKKIKGKKKHLIVDDLE